MAKVHVIAHVFPCAVIGNNPSTQLGFYVELALTVAFKMFSMCLIQQRSNISKGKFYSCHGNREREIDFKESRCQKKKKNQGVYTMLLYFLDCLVHYESYLIFKENYPVF